MSDPRLVTKAKGRINIPSEISIDNGIDLFNQGYGRALGAALMYLKEHHPEEMEGFKEGVLARRIYCINRIHIKQPVA